MALPQNAPLIIAWLQETFTLWQQFIHCNRPSATAILERYRRFADFDKEKLVWGIFLHQFKGGESSNQFRWFTTAKIDL